VTEIEADPLASVTPATEIDRGRRVASAGKRKGATTNPATMTAA
jgi:hypothetical protein